MSIYAGIDIAKKNLDVALPEEKKTKRFANDVEGIKACIELLQEAKVDVVVIEATGGYERELCEALFASEVGYALVNPSQVRHFAKGLNLKAKTDAIDAKLLLKYGQTRELQKQIPLSETETDLRSLSERRAQLSQMLAQEKNRLARATKRQRPSIDNHITWLEEELLALDEELKKLSAEEKEITQKIEIADTLPGIGPITAMQIVAHLPELGKIDAKSLAALVGVAPFNQDSGNFRGQRRCKGGRVRVRQALFLSTMGSLRCKANNPVKALYTRLVANGKKKMVAIVAAMHKQLTILNTMIRNGAHYDPVLAGFTP